MRGVRQIIKMLKEEGVVSKWEDLHLSIDLHGYYVNTDRGMRVRIDTRQYNGDPYFVSIVLANLLCEKYKNDLDFLITHENVKTALLVMADKDLERISRENFSEVPF